MLWQDLNRKIMCLFDGGTLPAMVYINKQKIDRDAVRRPLHSHDSICELLLIYKGEGKYHIRDQVYPLKEGCVVYYNQGDLHEVESGTNKEIGSYCIGITNLRKKNMPRNHLVKPGESYVCDSGSMFPMLKSMCEQMYELEAMNEDGKMSAQFLFNSFLIIACDVKAFSKVETLKRTEEQRGQRMREYLDKHFTEDLSLEQIGRALGCSATYVSHVFRNTFGNTPIQYVIQRRMGLAQTLLISTELSASQIATMVGYDNANYFSTLFSKTVGMSPTKYREFYKEEARGRRNQS